MTTYDLDVTVGAASTRSKALEVLRRDGGTGVSVQVNPRGDVTAIRRPPLSSFVSAAPIDIQDAGGIDAIATAVTSFLEEYGGALGLPPLATGDIHFFRVDVDDSLGAWTIHGVQLAEGRRVLGSAVRLRSVGGEVESLKLSLFPVGPLLALEEPPALADELSGVLAALDVTECAAGEPLRQDVDEMGLAVFRCGEALVSARVVFDPTIMREAWLVQRGDVLLSVDREFQDVYDSVVLQYNANVTGYVQHYQRDINGNVPDLTEIAETPLTVDSYNCVLGMCTAALKRNISGDEHWIRAATGWDYTVSHPQVAPPLFYSSGVFDRWQAGDHYTTTRALQFLRPYVFNQLVPVNTTTLHVIQYLEESPSACVLGGAACYVPAPPPFGAHAIHLGDAGNSMTLMHEIGHYVQGVYGYLPNKASCNVGVDDSGSISESTAEICGHTLHPEAWPGESTDIASELPLAGDDDRTVFVPFDETDPAAAVTSTSQTTLLTVSLTPLPATNRPAIVAAIAPSVNPGQPPEVRARRFARSAQQYLSALVPDTGLDPIQVLLRHRYALDFFVSFARTDVEQAIFSVQGPDGDGDPAENILLKISLQAGGNLRWSWEDVNEGNRSGTMTSVILQPNKTYHVALTVWDTEQAIVDTATGEPFKDVILRARELGSRTIYEQRWSVVRGAWFGGNAVLEIGRASGSRYLDGTIDSLRIAQAGFAPQLAEQLYRARLSLPMKACASDGSSPYRIAEPHEAAWLEIYNNERCTELACANAGFQAGGSPGWATQVDARRGVARALAYASRENPGVSTSLSYNSFAEDALARIASEQSFDFTRSAAWPLARHGIRTLYSERRVAGWSNDLSVADGYQPVALQATNALPPVAAIRPGGSSAADFDGAAYYSSPLAQTSEEHRDALRGAYTLSFWMRPEVVTGSRKVLTFGANGEDAWENYLVNIAVVDGEIQYFAEAGAGPNNDILVSTGCSSSQIQV